MSIIKRASKDQSFLRIVLHGCPGSGKTWTSLVVAHYLEKLYGYPSGSSVVADTERSSAQKYAGEVYNEDGDKFDFGTISDEFFQGVYSEKKFNSLLAECSKEKVPILIIDSFSHFWNGTGGIMDAVDLEAGKMKNPNSFVAWKSGDSIYRRMVQNLTTYKGHIICTLRAKMAYEQKTNDKGYKELQRLGMAPECRDHFVSELDIEGIIDEDHKLRVGKTRCNAVDGKVFPKPGLEFTKLLYDWATSGTKAKDVFAEIKADSANVKTKEDLDNFLGKIKNNKIFMSELEVEELRSIYNKLSGEVK